MSPAEIDAAVSRELHEKGTLYAVDERMLRELSPELIVTQNLCQVCAPSGNELSQALKVLPHPPKVLWQTPHTIDEIFSCLLELGRATGAERRAQELTASARERIERVRTAVASAPSPTRLVMMEWTDPPYCAGHWVPEMIEAAGGVDPLARRGVDSVRIGWEAIALARPEVLVLSPCGYDLAGATKRGRAIRDRPEVSALPAVRAGRAFAVDANAYFSRPGPRVAEGVELLASLLHPDRVAWTGADGAFAPL